MTQILGTGTGKTSSVAREPVVERKPAQVFFESSALAASKSGIYRAAALARAGTPFAGAAIGIGGSTGAAARTLLAPNPLTAVLIGLFYSPKLANGELPPDQLYQNIINSRMMVGAFTRAEGTVAQQNYVTESELRQIAEQKGKVRTRVRFRVEQDEKTGAMATKSYLVAEKSGLDRVRVRFARRLDDKTWCFEDPSINGQLIWSAESGEGKFVQGGLDIPVQLNPATTPETRIHEGGPGGYTSPPTPVPEPRKIWGLPNPVPEPLPPLPGTPIPDEQRPTIETFPAEDRDFNDFIIVDPLGAVPAIYVYFSKPPVDFLEVDYYINFKGRSRQGEYEVDHIPSKAAVKAYLKRKYPFAERKDINRMVDRVASVAIPISVHQQCSETYGGRNNRQPETINGEKMTKIDRDARNLESAVDANWDANAECLKRDHGVSDAEIEEVRARLHELNRNTGLYK